VEETGDALTPELSSLIALPALLAQIEFPQEQIEYPANWPKGLRYPSEFSLVDVSFGAMPGGAALGWAAKLRYGDEPSLAAAAMTSFLMDRDWQVSERLELESGGIALLVARESSSGSGAIVMEADPGRHGSSLLVATLFP
jgi:hypothetical protein